MRAVYSSCHTCEYAWLACVYVHERICLYVCLSGTCVCTSFSLSVPKVEAHPKAHSALFIIDDSAIALYSNNDATWRFFCLDGLPLTSLLLM